MLIIWFVVIFVIHVASRPRTRGTISRLMPTNHLVDAVLYTRRGRKYRSYNAAKIAWIGPIIIIYLGRARLTGHLARKRAERQARKAEAYDATDETGSDIAVDRRMMIEVA